MNLQTITIKEYLSRKDIHFQESNGELITHCLFNGCDENSRGKEAHLYFDADTGQYDCKKCGTQGNIVTLAKHLGDSVSDIALHSRNTTRQHLKFSSELVEQCHKTLPDQVRQYLNGRGITDSLIETYKLGWGKVYRKYWITIPK